ncbi:hypothetical protein C4J81_17630 [Deltaproteobacteria bacterium Smac51]|nr:hypothetical protein C4J81_17630 [Deltaproteobacteria bacterium Smac51]
MLSPGNFFERQDVAKRWSLLFGIAFSLAMMVSMLSIYVILSWLGWLFNFRNPGPFSLTVIHWLPAIITTVLTIIFLGASIRKMKEIMDGGSTYAATALGGHPLGDELIMKGAARNREKQLKNIVAEMALASGVTEPDIYILPLEQGINALATGLSPDDAAIVVTWGALKYLSRDEMSGLIAHEFSHILNGDMRHNTIMAGWLYGLFFLNILGRYFMSTHGLTLSRASVMAFAGAVLAMMVGSVSTILGRLLQSAFSRQREYLADASAVQFTRNSEGLAGVLKKIGGLTIGSRIKSSQMPDYRHFFIAQPDKHSLFSTHPPLDERIHALDPRWDGTYYDFAAKPISMESNI